MNIVTSSSHDSNVIQVYDVFAFPNFSAIREELVNSRAEVKSFDKSKLQHVETKEKNPLPDAQCRFILNSDLIFCYVP